MQFHTQHNANLVHGVSIVGTKGVSGKVHALLRADRLRALADRRDPSTGLSNSNSESGLGKQSCPGYSLPLSAIASKQAGWRRVAGRTAVVDAQVDQHAAPAGNAQAPFAGDTAATTLSATADATRRPVAGASMPGNIMFPAAMPQEQKPLSERLAAEPGRPSDSAKPAATPAPIWATFVLSRALSS